MTDDLIERLNAATEGTTPGLEAALRSYSQADYEGIFVTVSRQACEEGADAIAAARQLVPEAADALAAQKAEIERLREALTAHHHWHMGQDRDGAAWGIDPVDAYSESGLCEMTLAALTEEKTND